MRQLLFALVALFPATLLAQQIEEPTEHGLMHIESKYDVAETVERLKSAATKRGMTIFNHIDHQQAAQKEEIDLPPSQLLIMGNPKLGSEVMRCGGSAGLDLPFRFLAWEDEEGEVWLTYNSPLWLQDRHSLKNCERLIPHLNIVLRNLADLATQTDDPMNGEK